MRDKKLKVFPVTVTIPCSQKKKNPIKQGKLIIHTDLCNFFLMLLRNNIQLSITSFFFIFLFSYTAVNRYIKTQLFKFAKRMVIWPLSHIHNTTENYQEFKSIFWTLTVYNNVLDRSSCHDICNFKPESCCLSSNDLVV